MAGRPANESPYDRAGFQVLETFDDPLTARGYRDAVARELRARRMTDRYGVAIKPKSINGRPQWWVLLRDRAR